MRPTTIISIATSVLLGLGGVALAVYLLVDRQGDVKWHYWLAPFMMIIAGLTIFQLAALYMKTIGSKELRSRPPRD